MDLGLERVTRLLEALAPSSLPPPHLAFPIIHVAGTNGKGSICAYLSSILTTSGLRVGRYNSPHLITPRDTIQVNNQPISEADYQYATEIVKQKDAELGLKATSFELLTATAFYWFAYGRFPKRDADDHETNKNIAGVDIAVIEVGVGGRLDATNIVPNPKVCVIASIGMDHAGLLGNSIEEVAFEKAGIIKPGVPVVVAPQSQGQRVYKVVNDKAVSVGLRPDQVIKARGAHWINTEEAGEGHLTESSTSGTKTAHGQWASLDNGFRYWIPLLGDFQLENSAAAIAAVEVLRQTAESNNNNNNDDDGYVQWGHKITDETIRQGIKNTVWPGRLQWIEASNAPREVQGRILIDGAHNPAAAIALRSFIDEQIAATSSVSSKAPRTHWIMAFTKGKDIEEMFGILFSKYFSSSSRQQHDGQDTFSAVEFSPPEGMPWVSPIPSDEICERLRQQQERVHAQEEHRIKAHGFGTDLRAALEWVGKHRQEGDVVILCGSLYLVADLFRLE
ncbi:folylpolyglutamate synthase [Mortierella sp. GBA30]|nr:folylpolyglutamate synthase [Mortierella sp. GBA30]